MTHTVYGFEIFNTNLEILDHLEADLEFKECEELKNCWK